MKILIDCGHGYETPGKQSPNGDLHEWHYVRSIGDRVVAELFDKGYDVELVVKNDHDMSLSDRVKYANTLCNKIGTKNVIFVSIHVNAAGNGKDWANGRGWSCYTSIGQTSSDKLADKLYESAKKYFIGQKLRTDYARDGDADIEENFYVLKNTKCTAVLTENFFMDNKEDLNYLLSDEGKENIVKTHVDGIINYLKTLSITPP